eukprot:c16121_g1_i1.p1 GENE.c16121_g1_i1~~c16121_g1_i1.p1  ORF type:complete len:238 (-),score=48.72 c16121_g1_i1:44-757(-)
MGRDWALETTSTPNPTKEMARLRNKELIRGVRTFSHSRMYHLTGRKYIKNKTKPQPKPVDTKKKAPRFYPADRQPKPLARHSRNRPTHLRSSIKPGNVLIVLSGPYRGKRVVFLKQLESGLLLVTGPYKFNGVPLRRVNQTNVIATSTNIGDISKVDLAGITDAQFKKEKAAKAKKGEEALFKTEDKQKKPVTDEFKALQKKIDGAIVPLVKDHVLKSYLKTTFSLSNGQYPHLLKF